MPIAVTLPSVSPVPGNTIVAQTIIFALLPTAGSQLNFRVKAVAISSNRTMLDRKVASAGVLIKDRSMVIENAQQIRLTFDEFDANFFAEFVNKVQVAGTGRLWIKDPDDAANTAAWLSNEFSCVARLEGEIPFAMDAYAEATVVLELTGALTFTRDGSTTV
jgi:hypothetical protein